MKKIILLLTLFLTFTTTAQAQSCAANPLNFGFAWLGNNFEALITDKQCTHIELEDPKYCECLEKSNKNNVLIQALKGDGKDLATLKREKAKADNARLFNIMNNLNYEVGFQEETFNLVNGKNVRCTPGIMSSEMNGALDLEHTERPPELAAKANDSSAGLNLDAVPKHEIDKAIEVVNKAWESAPHVDDSKVVAAISRFSKVCSLNEAEDQNSIAIKKFQDGLKPALEFFQRYGQGLLKSAQVAELEEIITKPTCAVTPEDEILMNKVVAEFEFKSQRSKDFAAKGKDNKKKIQQQITEEGFNKESELTKEQQKKIYGKSLPKACVDYGKYKILKSAPTADMIGQWAGMETGKILESLDPGCIQKTNKNCSAPGRVGFPADFMKANPSIAKVLIVPGKREELALMLKNLATQSKGLSEIDRIKNYVKFMKTDIKKLTQGNEIFSAFQCRLLGRNFAAVSSVDELPSMELDSGDGVASLANNLLSCKVKAAEKLNPKQEPVPLTDIINSNDLFTLFDSNKLHQKAEDDHEYSKFLAEACPSFEEFAKEYVGKKCGAILGIKLGINKKVCTENTSITKKGRRKDMLEAYYKLNPRAGALNSMLDEQVAIVNPGEDQSTTVTNEVSRAATVAMDKQMGSKFQKSIFSTENVFRPANDNAVAGAENKQPDIFKSLEKAQTSFEKDYPQYSSSISNGLAQSSSPVDAPIVAPSNGDDSPRTVASAAASQQNSVNPGQLIPPFLDSKPLANKAEEKISSMDDVEDALGDLEGATPAEKKEIISKTKEYLNTQDQTNKDIAELQDKLTKYENEKVAAVADNTKVATRAPASVNAPAPAVVAPTVMNRAPSAMSSGSSFASQTQSSGSVSPTVRAQEKAKSSYEKALNQMNESRVEALSLVVDKGSEFDFNSSPAGRSDYQGGLVIGQSLESNDKLFAEISSSPEAMKAYLAQNLKEVPVDKVVSIKCKGSGCSPSASEILLVITKGPNNKFSVRSVSREIQVARSHKFLDLKNEINKATR